MNLAIGWICASRVRQALLLVAVCCAIFLPGLGSTGFSMSEGHRVIPAWEMLEDARSGNAHWMVPRMFETTYLRKPPGVMWAIAASSAVFGETEFAARLPSAIAAMLLVLSVWWFSTRWFGSPWGLAAGLAQALLPVMWPSARSAEIESLHILTTGVVCLLVADQLLGLRGGWARPLSWGLAIAVGLVLMAFTKGPAGIIFALATFVACFFSAAFATLGHDREDRGVQILISIAVPCFAVLALSQWAWGRVGVRYDHPFDPVVRQGVTEFMWQPDKIPQVLTLSLAVLVTMLPAALALLFPWGPDARKEREHETQTQPPAQAPGEPRSHVTPTVVARSLTRSGVLSLLFLTAAGISNPRYGLPVCALITPLVAYLARGAWFRGVEGLSPGGAFISKRPAIARAMFLGSPWAWPVVLLVAAGVYIGVMEPDRRASSGHEAGITLAAHLPDGAEVWADEMIEARPEVLLYAVREAARQGRRVRVRWLKPEFMPLEHPDGLLLLLREDERVDEVARFTAEQRFGTLTEIARGEVHKYTFVLCRVESNGAD
jgi:4-amino-4-deoxy-L-arabinose transferase-like glycosyltransferase